MDIAVYQLIAYVSLTLASMIVAGTSALIGYRQNFGWKPTMLVTGIGLSGIGGSKTYNAILTFEVWNRRKYPIALETASISYGNIQILEGQEKGNWTKWRNTMNYHGDKIRIEPLSHHQFKVGAAFKTDSLDAVDDTWDVQVTYFDPTSSKKVTLTMKANYKLQ